MLAALAAGCAVPREAGFGDVRKLVEGRGLPRIHWNQGTPEDAAVERHVHELLASDLTAASATEIAILNNASLQAIYERLGVAQADVVQAGLLRNPTIAGHVGIPIGAGVIEWEASFAFPLLDALLIPLRKRFATAEFERVKLDVADAVLAAASEARSAFWEVQAGEHVIALERTIVDAAQASAELAGRQHAAGNLSDLDLSAQQGMYVQARVDLSHAEVRRLAQRERLNRALGLWGAATVWHVTAALPELPKEERSLEHVESFAVAHRLDLLAAKREVDTRAAALRITKNTRVIGGLDLGASAHQDADGPRTLGPTISLEVPIFDQKQAQVARLFAELRASQLRADALAVTIRSEVRTARTRVLAARSTVEYYRTTLIPLRERIVALSQQQYNAMLLGVYQLLASKQAEIAAYREYIEAVRDYWIARSDLERAAGGPISEVSK